jgi:hypothetical protein
LISDSIKDSILGSHKNPINWCERGEDGIDEFRTNSLAAACFPTLFPYGRGDFTDKRRRFVDVSDKDAIKYYSAYADTLSNGRLSFRFAKHPMWQFWVMNRYNRHFLLRQTNAYVRAQPMQAQMSKDELFEQLKKPHNIIQMGLSRYEANLPGSNGFWYIKTEELKAAIREAGCPTLFFTLSMADNHWPDFYGLLSKCNSENHDNVDVINENDERARTLRENLHLSAWYFQKRAKIFTEQMREVLDISWYWQRIEAQRRGALHLHGCMKMENDSDLQERSRCALLGHLATHRLEHYKLDQETIRIEKNDDPNVDKRKRFSSVEIDAALNEKRSVFDEMHKKICEEVNTRAQVGTYWYYCTRTT